MTTYPREERIPTDVEAERALLACLLYNEQNVARVEDTLREEHFASNHYQLIYRAILYLYNHDRSCSIPSVCEELERTGALWDIIGQNTLRPGQAMRSLLDEIVDTPDIFYPIESFADRIKQASLMTRLYAAAARIGELALHRDEHALEIAEQLILDIALEADTKPVATLAEALGRYIEELDERCDNFQLGMPGGIPTGFHTLDRLLGGLHKSRLYTLAARPGYGKTSLALAIALSMAKHQKHALVFSLEMDEDEIVERFLASDTPLPQSQLRDGDLSDDERRDIRNRAEILSPCDLKIEDRTYLLSEIRNKARRAHLKQHLDLIVIDYLQLIDIHPAGRAKNETRPEEVARISKGLKRLARELKVPVLALAQMNREQEKRSNDKPRLSDLGDSSGIERDSDCVMFIYCDNEQQEKRERSEIYSLDIIAKKHRNGPIGEARLLFDPSLTQFKEPEVNLEDYLTH